MLNASKGMIRVKDPVTLLKIITRFIDRQIGVTHVAVLLHDKKRVRQLLVTVRLDHILEEISDSDLM